MTDGWGESDRHKSLVLINFIVLVRATRARSARVRPLNRRLTDDDVIEHPDVNELEGVAAHTPVAQRQFTYDSALAVGTVCNRYLSQIAVFYNFLSLQLSLKGPP